MHNTTGKMFLTTLLLPVMAFIIIDCSSYTVSQTPPAAQTPPGVVQTTNTQLADEKADTNHAHNLGVQDWVGKKFILLEKQQFLKQYGYEIYTNLKSPPTQSTIDTTLELPNHRIRCDRFEKSYLFAIEVKPDGGEFIVTFTSELTEKKLYGRTHNTVIKDIALSDNLDQARKRWLGDTVYACNRVTSTWSEKSTSLGSYKVRITEKLKVIDITWGTTPMPVKPLWVWVESESKQKGFIPLFYDYTNNPSAFDSTQEAWRTDLLDKDPKIIYKWDQVFWDAIENHSVLLGMTREQVRLTWGPPLSVSYETENGVQRECWNYAAQKLFFNDTELFLVK